MRQRSLSIIVLAFSSVMIGLYCQFAAVALILTGSVFTVAGSTPAAITLVIGATFLGLTVGAYFLGYGLWTRKHWSWAGSIALLAVLVGASLALSVISSSYISSISPVFVAIVGAWYLNRPAIKAGLLGPAEPTESEAKLSDRLEAAEPAR